jgi:L-asparagine transporter-like permease
MTDNLKALLTLLVIGAAIFFVGYAVKRDSDYIHNCWRDGGHLVQAGGIKVCAKP